MPDNDETHWQDIHLQGRPRLGRRIAIAIAAGAVLVAGLVLLVYHLG